MTEITIAINLEQYRKDIHSHYGNAASELVEVGKLLSEVRHNLPEDATFGAFVDTLPFSRRSAFNYIRLHEHYLNHGSAIVALNNINIKVWYQLPPDSKAVEAVIKKAEKGGKVTAKDAKTIVNSIEFDDPEKSEAWHQAATTNPKFVVESARTGTVTDLDGIDRPLTEADPTLIQVNSIQLLSESIHRQKVHIEENTSPTEKITGTIKIVRGRDGVVYPAIILDSALTTKLVNKEVTVYLPTDSEKANAA